MRSSLDCRQFPAHLAKINSSQARGTLFSPYQGQPERETLKKRRSLLLSCSFLLSLIGNVNKNHYSVL